MGEEGIVISAEMEAAGLIVGVQEVIKSLSSAQREMLHIAETSETGRKATEALGTAFLNGSISAKQLREGLIGLVGTVPQTAEELRQLAQAEARAAAEAKKLGEEQAKLIVTQEKLDGALKDIEIDGIVSSFDALDKKYIDLARRTEKGAFAFKALDEEFREGRVSADDYRAGLLQLTTAVTGVELSERKAAREAAEAGDRMRALARIEGPKTFQGHVERASERLVSLGRTAGVVVGAIGTVATAVVAGGAALLHAAEGADDHAKALRELGPAYDLVRESTNDTVSAWDAFRARQVLVNSGLRVSGTEFAAIARHAREHAREGENAADATMRFAEALRNGEQGGLRSFGIAVQQGATRAATFESALRQMGRAAADSAPEARDLGEELERTQRILTESGSSLALAAVNALGLRDALRWVGDAARTATREILDLVQRSNEIPTNNARNERQHAAQMAYLAEQRRVTEALRASGASDEQIRAALPQTQVSRLTEAQARAAADRLLRVRERIAGSAGGQATADDIAGGLLAGGIGRIGNIGPDRAQGVRVLNTNDTARETEMAGVLEGLRAARRGDAEGQNRAELLGALRATAQQLAADDAANIAARQPATAPTGPRDSAPTGQSSQAALQAARREMAAAIADKQSEYERLQRQIALEVQAMNDDIADKVAEGDRLAREYNDSLEGRLAAMRRSRQDAADQREADLADLRSGEGSQGRLDARRGEDQLAREQQLLDNRYRMNLSFTEQMEALYQRQTGAAESLASSLHDAFGQVGSTMGEELDMIFRGQQGVLEGLETGGKKILDYLAKTAWAKAGFFGAEALGNLAFGNFAGAAVAGKAAAAYAGAGVVLSLVAGQVGAGAKDTPAPSSGRSERASTGNRDTGARSTVEINHNYYAPRIGGANGREASEWETGEQLRGYTEAASSRSRRERMATQ